MNDAELMQAVGQALFGERYKSDLAGALEVSRDTVDDWTRVRADGSVRMRPRPGVWQDLAPQIRQRIARLQQLLPLVEAAAKREPD